MKKYLECSNEKACVSVQWLAQCHAIWQRGCRVFQYPAVTKPMLTDSLPLELTSTTQVQIQMNSHVWQPQLQWFFAYWIFIFRLLKSFQVIMVRQNTPEFLTYRIIDFKPFFNTYYHLIRHKWEMKCFSLCTFFAQCSLMQLIDLRNVKTRTWNLWGYKYSAV